MGIPFFFAAVGAHALQLATLPVVAPQPQLATHDSKPAWAHRHGALAVPLVTSPRVAAIPARLPRSRGTDLVAP